jgi:hypothetical protein
MHMFHNGLPCLWSNGQTCLWFPHFRSLLVRRSQSSLNVPNAFPRALPERHWGACITTELFCLIRDHFTHEPRAVTMRLWEPKRKCPKAVPRHLQNHSCGHGPSSVLWSHMWPGPQPNAISMNFSSCGSVHMIKWNKPTVVTVWSPMVSRFCVRPTSKRWFLKIVQVAMKHDPFDAT